MIYCKLIDIKKELIKLFKSRMLIPVIGAGFSFGCQAKDGKTPSGEELKVHMLSSIEKAGHSIESIKSLELKRISLYYKKIVNEYERKKYLLDNFTEVVLPDYQVNFLSINWLYIYTLNIDTAIEENSQYKRIILPNRSINNNLLEKEKCLFKLHGDVIDYTQYNDSKSYIFDYEEYTKSLNENHSLLNMLSNDFCYNNILFVGCSLKDEIDLLSSYNNPEISKNYSTSKYYVTTSEPDLYTRFDLESYGITHVIIVDNYKQFYEDIYKIYIESTEIQNDDLEDFKNIKSRFVSGGYKENIDYLLYGKSLYNAKSKMIILPDFFIRRSIVSKIIEEMNDYSVQVICGGHISGKSYCLVSILTSIKNRDNYYFNSRVSLNQEAIDYLSNKNGDVLLFDTSSLSKEQILSFIGRSSEFKKRNLNIIICINKSDKDIISSIKYLSNYDQTKIYDLSNKFNKVENDTLNSHLSRVDIHKFRIGSTILDNIFIILNDTKNSKGNSINKTKLEVSTKYEMMVIILLAIKEKLYNKEFIDFNIEREIFNIHRKITPIVDEDYTYLFEKTQSNSSNYKIFLNSKYWILNKLGEFSTDSSKHNLIIEAYKSIVDCLIKNYGFRYKNIEDYIKYDVINEIFFKEERGNLRLIKSIYDGLNDLLADNPHFHHQKAKCYLWHSKYADNIKEELKSAYRFATVARHNLRLEDPYEKNLRINISVAHMDFTIAIIVAKQNSLEQYKNTELFKLAIEKIALAIENVYNKEYVENLIERRDKKVNDILAFISYSQTNDLDYLGLNSIEKKNLVSLINRIYNIKAKIQNSNS